MTLDLIDGFLASQSEKPEALGNDKVELIVDGVSFQHFTSISITRSMTQMAGEFSFEVSQKFKENVVENFGIYMGAPCQVKVNDKKIIDGYIDEIPLGYSASSYNISFDGRDKTADLVDCSVDFAEGKNSFKNQTAGKILEKLCDPFGINVQYHDVDASVEMNDSKNPMEDFTVDVGSPVFDSISKLCKRYAVLPYSIGDGNLTIGKAGVGLAFDGLEGGVNILSATLGASDRNRFKVYKTKNVMGESIFPARLLKGEIEDEGIDRYRTIVITDDNLNTPDACQARCAWEARVRAGKSRKVDITVQGWAQSNDLPWPINALVHIRDDYLGLDEDRLIVSVENTVDSGSGSFSNLELVKPETFDQLKSTQRKVLKKGYFATQLEKDIAKHRRELPKYGLWVTRL
jgi:prophage tail gpP-like protein